MDELLKKIDDMLEAVLKEEREYIDELCLDEEYDNIEDIPIDEPDYIDFSGKYGWQIRRDYEYISEKKAILVNLKELFSIMSSDTDPKKMHKARKELEETISDARYYRMHKKEDIDTANEVNDVMNNVIEICQKLTGKKN